VLSGKICSVLAAGIAVALMIAASVAVRPKPAQARGPQLVGRLIFPAPTDGDVIEAPFSREIALAWDVRNVGQSTTTGLRAKLVSSCQCKIQEKLPETLRPGETGRFVARLRAPQAGTALREVPIFDDKDTEPLLTLTVWIRARVSAPSWLTPPTSAMVQGVAGRPFQHILTWDAIENAGESSWVESISGEPADFATLKLDTETRAWGEDGKFTLRKYHVTIANPETPVGRSTGSIRIDYRSEPAEPQRVPINLELISALAVLPAKVDLGPSRPFARVTVVRRDSQAGAAIPKFDASLLHVECKRPSASAPMVYEIRPVPNFGEATTTEVLFEADGLEPARLIVRIVPTPAGAIP
jgi:hypothetical protein